MNDDKILDVITTVIWAAIICVVLWMTSVAKL